MLSGSKMPQVLIATVPQPSRDGSPYLNNGSTAVFDAPTHTWQGISAEVSGFAADEVERVREIRRVAAGDFDPVAADRMVESEPHSVQPLPGQVEPVREGRVSAIGEIPHTWVPKRSQVDANLMGTSGLQGDVQERRGPESLQGVIVSDRRLPSHDDRPLVVVRRVPVDRSVDGAAKRVRMTLHQRVISLIDPAVAEGPLERGIGSLGLRYHHQA